MSERKDSTDSLLQELLALQDLFEDQDNIPILDEPFAHDTTFHAATEKTVASAVSTNAVKPENPFLPRAMIDRLTHERIAAQHSAEEAHRTMQQVMDRKQQQARQALTNIGKSLTAEQKDALITDLVDEMLPQIAERLRHKLKIMLNRWPAFIFSL